MLVVTRALQAVPALVTLDPHPLKVLRPESAPLLILPLEERTVVLEMRDRYERTYRRIIERGVAAGVFRADRDPALMAILVLSLLNALDRWYRPGGPNDPDEISQHMYEFVTNGIG